MVKSIDEVFQKPFSEQTIEEKIRTLLEGKPRPPLPDVFINGTEFDISFYHTELWITACERRRTFFCWSCLLFTSENESEWTKEGYGNYELLHDGMEKHKCTVNHVSGILQLNNFVREKVIPLVPVNYPKMSETKKKYLRKRLLDFMLVLLSHTANYPPAKGNECDQYILAKCTQDLMLLKKYEDKEFGKIIENFSRPEMVTNYIDTLSSMMKTMITEEIQKSTYVSLIINEHFCTRNGTLISFMFRYIRNEEICDRFLMFTFMTTSREIGDLISNVLREFDIKKDKDKFIAFSFDSAMTSMSPLRSFVIGMKQDYGVLFFPCYFHSFETIIERSISEVDNKSRIFFKTVSGVRDYVNRSFKIQAAFEDFIKEQFDLYANQSSFKFIILLKNYKELFSEFFKAIKQNMKKWQDDDVIIAIGLHKLLDDPETITSMEIFFALSPIIVRINNILCSSTPERILNKYRRYKKTLNDMKTDGFQNIWNNTSAKVKEIHPNIFISSEHEENFRTEFKDRFDEIVNCVLGALRLRIEPLVKYSDYLSICSPKFEKLLPENRKDFAYFPMKNTLNPVELQNEIYELRKKYPALTGKREYEVYKFLVKEKLQDTYTTLFKALQAILTTPYKTASLDNSLTRLPPKTASKLDAINFWSKVYGVNQKFTNDWCFMCIERDFLDSLLTNEGFCKAFYTSFEKDHDLFQGL